MEHAQRERHSRYLLIRASAGSGKTFQLIHALAGLLLSGRPVESVLATTFSRKAAREILDRLLSRLRSAAQDDQQAAAVAQVIGRPLTADDCCSMLRRLVDCLDRVNIGTLDRFFVRVAQRFRLELDLPWTWNILEEDDDRRLRLRAISEMLASEESAKAADWVRLLTKGHAARSVTDQILELVYQLYDLVFLESAETAWNAIPGAAELSDPEVQAAIRALREKADLFAVRIKDQRFKKAFDADIERASSGDWQHFVTRGIANAVARESEKGDPCTYYGKVIDGELEMAYRPLVTHAQAVLRSRLRRQTEAMFRLLGEFHRTYEAAKRRGGGLTFADVTRCVRDGLARQHPDSERTAYRLDGRIEHLLLDEFQDTSMPQWEALRPIVQSVRGSAQGTLFCVGDVKQSIYGWRGSEPAIIEGLPDELPGIEIRPLDRSYRSSPIVIDTVNLVFDALVEHLISLPGSDSLDRSLVLEAAKGFGRAFQSHDTARTELEGYCVLMSKEASASGQSRQEDSGENGGPEEVLPESSRAVRLIKELHHRYPELEIGVLFRKRNAMPPLLAGLRREGIPVSEEAGNPLDLAPGVRAILSLLRLADHPGDTAAAFHVAHSPLAEAVDWTAYPRWPPDQQAEARRTLSLRLRAAIAIRGYGPVVYEFARRLVPWSAVEDLPRLERLAVSAYAYQERGRLRVDDFIRRIESLREAEPSQGVVRVMTIHAAKGLQFPIVVLPDLDERLGGQTPNVAADRGQPSGKYDWVCPWLDQSLREANVVSREFAARFDRVRTREIRESLCLLYVAMTRAVHALYLLIAPSRDNEKSVPLTWAGILRAALTAEERSDQINIPPVPPKTKLWSHGKADWRSPRGTIPPTSPPSSLPEKGPILLARKPQHCRAVQWLSPHSLEGRDRTLRDLFRRPPQRALDKGSVLHLWFSQIEWLEDGVPDDGILLSLAEKEFSGSPATAESLAALLDEFRRVLRGDAVRKLLSRHGRCDFLPPEVMDADRPLPGDTWIVWKERPFAIFLDDGTFCRGQFDRVVAVYRKGQPFLAQVIDFKTDQVFDTEGEENAASADGAGVGAERRVSARAAFYQPQMEKYREAVALLLGLPRNRVAAALAFVYPGKVVPLGEAVG